ncbi:MULTISPECIES: peptidoglycan endopeptidase [Flavobacterium]|uniref:LysM peptidoglycan-binding domain-containing protein n=1 Tax=Flavobacterium covae TaxID=2906076 RepID=A0ABW8PHE7_9FLAO|nr:MULTISPECIES: peptidoglycan endopeptidase [Flavobacterium]
MDFQKKIIYSLLWFSVSVFGQEKIKHKVMSGESVYSIAQKYNVKQSKIIELNPKAKKTLQLNMILEIPISKVKDKEQPQVEILEHEVLTKETLYSLSKKYNTTIEKIKEVNPNIELQGLKIGEHIKIPTEKGNELNLIDEKPKKNKKNKKEETLTAQGKTDISPNLSGNTIELLHEVQIKETKYGISRKYGISITELESLNPQIKNNLAIGDKLIIKTKSIPENTPVLAIDTKSQNSIKEVVTSKETVPQKEVEAVKTSENIIPAPSKKGQIKIVEIKPQIEEENTDELIIESEAVQPEIPITVVAPLSEENISKAEFLITKASENIGARYRSGSTGNGGFDCSGLMFATFKNIEMTLPRSSREMAQRAGVRIDRSQAQKGDLIFFATRGRGVGHVGMITEVIEDEIKFIHSSTSQGVIISSTKEPYYAKRFVQINRVLLDE